MSMLHRGEAVKNEGRRFWTHLRMVQVVAATPGVWWLCYWNDPAGEDIFVDNIDYFALCEERVTPIGSNENLGKPAETVLLPLCFCDGYFDPENASETTGNCLGFTHAKTREEAVEWARKELRESRKP